MALTRCTHGHYYDADQHGACPHCSVPGVSVPSPGGTRPVGATPPVASASGTVPLGGGGAAGGASATDGRTVGVVRRALGIDPVVGWLVSVAGPERGRDYRLRSGRNFIGRADHMHVCVHGDPTVSREKHAVVSYDAKHGRFSVAPGESAELTYLNGEPVEVPRALRPRDVVEVGETRLLFVPLCDDDFTWTADEG
jgi:hypothetical protein